MAVLRLEVVRKISPGVTLGFTFAPKGLEDSAQGVSTLGTIQLNGSP
jgi:hypothetical protein